jgi:transcriptional regulator with XRE-family HTH domain
MGIADGVVEQIIRPTGLVDPQIKVKPTKGQIDDVLESIRERVAKDERVLITTLTKKMSEDLNPLIQEHLPEIERNKISHLPQYPEIGERFKIARGNRTAIEIEALSGVSNSIVGRCEKGQQSPNLELLAYYSRAENISTDLILLGANVAANNLVSLRIQCLALPQDQRIALARELLADLEQTDAP